MLRFFKYVAVFFLLTLTVSCAKLLRPVTGGPSKQGRNANKNDTGNFAFSGTILRNVVYATAPNYIGVNQQLQLDVFRPANAEGKKFPAIFLFHGGGFVSGNKTGLTSTSSKLASKGYVVIPVDYRLGYGSYPKATSCSDSNLLKQAIFRSVQDAHSAINFIAKHADEYNVDKDWIFVGGQSAGAITALITAYLQKADENTLFPNFTSNMGDLNADNGGNYTIKGVISMWGAFINPQLITAKTALPTIFFQGELDKTVPFNSRPFVGCASATKIYGTSPLYNRLKSLDETVIAHVDPQGGHGVFDEDFRVNNILCFLNDVRQGIKKQVYLTGVQSSCDK